MTPEDNYIDINKKAWNAKTEIHVKSDFYDMDGFMKGKSSLNDIELDLLGDVKGKTILHLQCHFGQDSISLAKQGALVTGVDFSDKAINRAQNLGNLLNTQTQFICSDIYDLKNHLNEKFDIVFTSYGTIGWLPDIEKWAEIVSTFLKPNGQFIFVEFHPVVWMFDDNFKKIKYRYFNSGPIYETETGTYADKNSKIEQNYVMWNHGIGEVVNSLIKHQLEIQLLNEYDYSPYDCFLHTTKIASNKFRISHLQNNIPMVYAIKAKKK